MTPLSSVEQFPLRYSGRQFSFHRYASLLNAIRYSIACTLVLCSFSVTPSRIPTTHSVTSLVQRTTDEGSLHVATRMLRSSSVPADGCETLASAALLLIPGLRTRPLRRRWRALGNQQAVSNHTPRSSSSISPTWYVQFDLSLQALHISRPPYKWPVRPAATYWPASEVV